MKNEFLVLSVVALVVLSTVGLTLAAPTKANGPDFRNQDGVGIWTGNGGFISWWPDTMENHYICKGTERLPQQAIDNKLEHGWWLSNQGPDGAETICKQSGLGNDATDEPEE